MFLLNSVVSGLLHDSNPIALANACLQPPILQLSNELKLNFDFFPEKLWVAMMKKRNYELIIFSWFQVAWLRVNTQTILSMGTKIITMNPRYSVSSHLDLGAGTSKSILRFENVKPSDQGSYMCQLNTLGSLGQTGFLTVTGNQFLDTEIPKRLRFIFN